MLSASVRGAVWALRRRPLSISAVSPAKRGSVAAVKKKAEAPSQAVSKPKQKTQHIIVKPLPDLGLIAQPEPTSTLPFLQNFDAATFGQALADFVDNPSLDPSSLSDGDLRQITSSCEQWTSMQYIATRRAADVHLVLCAHAILNQPLSATLRANTRLWLSAKCLSLTSAELFPFFGHLPALAGDEAEQIGRLAAFSNRLFRSPAPEPKIERAVEGASRLVGRTSPAKSRQMLDAAAEARRARGPDTELVARMARQAHRHFAEASPGDLTRFLTDFGRLGVDPSQFKPGILEELFDLLAKDCRQLTVEEGLALAEAIDSLALKPGDGFWRAFGERFGGESTGDGPERFLDVCGSLLKKECISAEISASLTGAWTESVAANLSKKGLREMLSDAQALSQQPDTAAANLTENDALWPALLETAAKDLSDLKGDWRGLQALIQTLAWAPNKLCAQVEELIKQVCETLSHEVVEMLPHTYINDMVGATKDTCSMMYRRLKYVERCRVRSQFEHDNCWWHPRSATSRPVEDTLHNLAYVPTLVWKKFMTPATGAWWSAFRQAMLSDPFLPSADNWTQIVRTLGTLCDSEAATRLARQHLQAETADVERVFALPPQWYSAFVRLAATLEFSRDKPGNFEPLCRLLGLLRQQHVRLDVEPAAQLQAVFERYCSAAAGADFRFLLTLADALNLQLLVSDEVWRQVTEHRLRRGEAVPGASAVLMTAAGYRALGLPGAPSEEVLRHLLQVVAFDTDWSLIDGRWQKLQLLLGDELMPKELLRLRALAHTLQPVKVPESAGSERLQARLKLQYGAANVQTGVVLYKAAGQRVDYLVTKADGSQKVYRCDSPRNYYWQMPSDKQGGLTLTMLIFKHLIEKAGYEFELVDIESTQASLDDGMWHEKCF